MSLVYCLGLVICGWVCCSAPSSTCSDANTCLPASLLRPPAVLGRTKRGNKASRSLQQLVDARVLAWVESPADADLVIRCLDKVDENEDMARSEAKQEEANQQQPERVEHVMFWSSGGFGTLSDYVKQNYGHSIISQGFPGVEELCCRALSAALDCPLNRFVVGRGHFRYSQ